MNKLHFGDNLDILRNMDDEIVDLICTDPPFNAGRNYNIFRNKSSDSDNWTWDKTAEDTRAYIEIKATNCPTYSALNDCLRGFDQMLRNTDPAIRAFLTFMGPRLVEMHRILAKTGSIYLHSDPTASHYLKCMMDAIFGKENFRNEIVWHYRRAAPAGSQFHRMHDIILFYTKTDDYVFPETKPVYKNDIFVRDAFIEPIEEKPITLKNDKRNPIRRRKLGVNVSMRDVWDDINPLFSLSIERLDYPTQKPRLLYERMIKASSNEGDLVLDPFCGGGTTLDAAQALKRHWIGIDISILAFDPITYRLKDRYGLEPSKENELKDYEIEGYPASLHDVKKLADDKTKHDEFSYWVITRPGLTPAKNDKKDNQATLWTLNDRKRSDVRIVAEVKAGKPTSKHVRALQKSIEDNDANIGILITLEPVTSEMREIADTMEKFEYRGLTFPRLQFWQITDKYFQDPETIYDDLQLPGKLRFKPTKKEDRFLPDFKFDLNLK